MCRRRRRQEMRREKSGSGCGRCVEDQSEWGIIYIHSVLSVLLVIVLLERGDYSQTDFIFHFRSLFTACVVFLPGLEASIFYSVSSCSFIIHHLIASPHAAWPPMSPIQAVHRLLCFESASAHVEPGPDKSSSPLKLSIWLRLCLCLEQFASTIRPTRPQASDRPSFSDTW